jgi:hypothetical protein
MLVFDTSAFINGWRYHYPPVTFPSVWDLIGSALKDGRIVSPRAVFTELCEKDDKVAEWATTRKALFVEPSEEVQRLAGEITAMLQTIGGPTAGVIRDKADPFVIAEAEHRKFTAVTYEGTHTFTGRRSKRWETKMPGLCQQRGVDCRIVPEALALLNVEI